MISDASISEDGQYRYWLRRDWSDRPRLTFAMLNPSTADATQDDATIRKILKYAMRERSRPVPRKGVQYVYGGLMVVNLFAYRATQPAAMLKAADPVGPENDATIKAALDEAAKWQVPVVCAWGLHGRFRERYRDFVEMANRAKARLVCLGQSPQSLQPFHPLYQKDDAPFVPYDMDGGL